MNVTEDISAQLAEAYARNIDAVVGKAISCYLGTTEWELKDIVPRMRRIVYGATPNKRDILYIDGQELVEFHEPTYSMTGTMLTMTGNHRMLWKPPIRGKNHAYRSVRKEKK